VPVPIFTILLSTLKSGPWRNARFVQCLGHSDPLVGVTSRITFSNKSRNCATNLGFSSPAPELQTRRYHTLGLHEIVIPHNSLHHLLCDRIFFHNTINLKSSSKCCSLKCAFWSILLGKPPLSSMCNLNNVQPLGAVPHRFLQMYYTIQRRYCDTYPFGQSNFHITLFLLPN
jgi:hypothetical protein